MNKCFYTLLEVFPKLIFVSSFSLAQRQAADRGLLIQKEKMSPGVWGLSQHLLSFTPPQRLIFPSRPPHPARVAGLLRCAELGSVYTPDPHFSIWGRFCPAGDSRQRLETIFVVTTQREGVLPAARGLRPGMLLNILQCTGQIPPQRMLRPKMSVKLKLRNPPLHQGLASVLPSP